MNATQNKSAPSWGALRVGNLLGFAITSMKPVPLDIQPTPLQGFVTFFDPGWSILRLREAVANKGTILYPQTWYDDEPFALLEEPPRYRQLRMTAVPDSLDKTFTEQQALVPADEEIPTARVVIMGMVIHFLANGERLFPDSYVRCADKTSDVFRVRVGDFDSYGFFVDYYWDDVRYSVLGLTAARKF